MAASKGASEGQREGKGARDRQSWAVHLDVAAPECSPTSAPGTGESRRSPPYCSHCVCTCVMFPVISSQTNTFLHYLKR